VTTLAQNLYLLVAAYGLALSVSYAGLPVLGQGAFVSVGAFGTLLLAMHGTPLLVAVVAAVAAAALAGYVVGFAAARLEGATLALATWGLAWLAYVALQQFPTLSGGSDGLVRPAPARLASPSLGVVVTLHTWVHVVIAALLVVVIALAVRRSAHGPWGLDWAAIRTSAALADTLGVPVQRRRRAVLAASAALGALGGAGTALLLGLAAPADYSPLLSLQLFVAVLVGGTARWWGPVVGVALLAALPSASDGIATAAGVDPLRAQAVLTAALLVAALALRQPIAALLSRLGDRWSADRPLDPVRVATAPTAPTAPTVETDAHHVGSTLVHMSGIRVDYSGVRALDGVDLEVAAGEVHALVGPNGSGKSTVLGVAAGTLAPDAGVVSLRGRGAPAAGAAASRVRAGVARTLQRTAMLGDLPADVQAAVGARARDSLTAAGWRHLLATRTAAEARRERLEHAADALAVTGLTDRATLPAARLDSAEQRLVQVARAVATGAAALLLDEPAAGMSRPQRDRLEAVLRALAARGHGVLLVEHDMGLVGRVADRVTVLAEGRVLASGAPDVIRADARVRAAYLGETPSIEERTRA
jgi:branched-chain amino acid transport system permease protein